MDNTQISEKTFSVPLGFGGYLLTIMYYNNISQQINRDIRFHAE